MLYSDPDVVETYCNTPLFLSDGGPVPVVNKRLLKRPEPKEQSDQLRPSESLMHDVKQIERRRLRLVIAIPTLVVLFTIGVGILNYQVADYYASNTDNPALKSVLDLVAIRILLFSLVVSIVALVFGMGLAYSIIHPIKRMTETTRSIATGSKCVPWAKIEAKQPMCEV